MEADDDDEGGGGFTAVESEATKSFQSYMPTKTEFSRHGGGMTINGKKYTNYNDYIDASIEKWYNEGKLTEDEAATLIAYYGLA